MTIITAPLRTDREATLQSDPGRRRPLQAGREPRNGLNDSLAPKAAPTRGPASIRHAPAPVGAWSFRGSSHLAGC
jgi:hypothetical protein